MSRLAARLRSVHAQDESGFMLIYVLMVTTVVTVLVGTTLVVASGSVVPSVQNAHRQAADAAAQGGLQAFVAYADEHCAADRSSVATCTLPSTDSGLVSIYSGSDYTSTYHWTAVKGTDYFRVTSTGTVTRGRLSSSKTLIADVAGGTSANTLDYGVVTQFETQSPDAVLQQFPGRTIALSPSALAAAGVPATGDTVTWTGAASGSAAGSVNPCNTVFYGSDGRVNSLPPNAPHQYVDWSERGAVGGNTYTNYQPCQVSLSHSTRLLGPVNAADGAGGYATRDALLVSNGYPGGTGPLLDQPVTTGFQYNPATDGNCATTGRDYRTFNLLCAGYTVDVGGSPATGSAYVPQHVAANAIPTPPAAAPVIAADACVYNGPTRVRLNGDGSATITSPQTTATWVAEQAAGRPSGCYPGASATGMRAAVVAGIAEVANGVLYVQNSATAPPASAAAHTSTGWNTTGQRRGDTPTETNTVFYLSGGAPAASAQSGSSVAADACPSGYSAANNAACAWTNVFTGIDGNGGGTRGWMSYLGSASTLCTGLVPTDRQQFECDFGGGSVTAGHDNYGVFRGQVASDLAAAACDTGTTDDQLDCLAAVFTARTPSHLDTANHTGYRYVVSAKSAATATTSTETLSTNPAPATGDPLFETAAGTPTTQTKTVRPMTFTISRQTWKCSLLDLLGVCIGTWGWGGSVAQFTVTVTHTTYELAEPGSAGVSYFPSMSDVTQYATGSGGPSGPGDLYVDGTAGATLALVAQNDVVLTGSLAPATAKHAVEVVGRNNVRVYHPVQCVATAGIATTTPGFCPDDVTGLYSGVLADGARPDQQYANLRPDLADLTVNAAVFALGNAPSTIACPLAADGSGVCGGMLTVDNFNRGTGLGGLAFTGSVAMAHHGPVGEEWEIPAVTGQTSRPYSGYHFTSRYENLKSRLAEVATVGQVVTSTATTSSLWRIVSVSTGANP